MKAKKEELLNKNTILSFVGIVTGVNLTYFGEKGVQELFIKKGRERLKILNFDLTNDISASSIERRFNAIEKETNEVSFEIFDPVPELKRSDKDLREFWMGGVNDGKRISMEFETKDPSHNKIEVKCQRFIPYLKKVKRVKYYELMNSSKEKGF